MAGSGLLTVSNVTDTELTVWGIGLVQNIDAAATELYLSYRNFSADVTGCIADSCGTASPDDFHAVIGGARVKF